MINFKLKSIVFGGEGIFLATLRGTGRIWLQSMPIRKLIQTLAPYGKNTRKEAGSILGNPGVKFNKNTSKEPFYRLMKQTIYCIVC